MSETFDYILMILPALLQGSKIIVVMFFMTLIFAIPLGLPLALGSDSKVLPVRWACRAYVFIFRGTPLMLQLFFIYFMLPIYFGLRIDALPAAIITFVLNYAAYLSEIYRGGIGSIERGQYEASICLGLNKFQTMFDIIIPQAIKRVLPSVTNEMITLVKDTALVSVLGVADLMKNSRAAVNRDGSVMAYLVAAIIYLILNAVLTKLSYRFEDKLSKHEVRSNR